MKKNYQQKKVKWQKNLIEEESWLLKYHYTGKKMDEQMDSQY